MAANVEQRCARKDLRKTTEPNRTIDSPLDKALNDAGDTAGSQEVRVNSGEMQRSSRTERNPNLVQHP